MPILDVLRRAPRRLSFESRLLQWKLLSRVARRATVDTPQGRFMVRSDDIGVSRHLWVLKEFELEFIRKSIQLLRDLGHLEAGRPSTLLEVGGNIGVISIGMLRHEGTTRSIAVEPDPRTFELLKHNVVQNGYQDRILCFNCAASDRLGTMDFEVCDSNFGDSRVRLGDGPAAVPDRYDESSRRVIQVPVETVDSVVRKVPEEFRDTIGLLWADVQGFEGHVFRGAEGLLSRGIPAMVEIDPYLLQRAGTTADAFQEICNAHWSRFWMLRRGRWVKYPTSVLQSVFDELGYEGEYDNVLFVP